MTGRRNILCLTAMLLGLAWPGTTAAWDEPARPRAEEAAFIFNLMRFTTWPEGTFSSAEEPIHIAVIGNVELAQIMRTLARKQTINGRPLMVEPLAAPPSGGSGVDAMRRALSGSHAVFIDDTEREHVPVLLRAINDRPILTFSNIERFAATGGMIEIAVSESRIVFEANLGPIKEGRLLVSSKALKLARKVHGQEDAR